MSSGPMQVLSLQRPSRSCSRSRNGRAARVPALPSELAAAREDPRAFDRVEMVSGSGLRSSKCVDGFVSTSKFASRYLNPFSTAADSVGGSFSRRSAICSRR